MRFEARVPNLGMRKFLATNLERDPQTNAWRWVVNLPVLTASLADMAKSSVLPGDYFGGETLFVIGGKSHYVDPVADRACITSFFPVARMEVIAEAGHNPHMDSRVEFVRVVFVA